MNEFERAMREGSMPQDAILKGMPMGQPVAQPMIPKKVQDYIEAHVKEGKAIEEALEQEYKKLSENAEQKDSTTALLVQALLWLVKDRLPIDIK